MTKMLSAQVGKRLIFVVLFAACFAPNCTCHDLDDSEWVLRDELDMGDDTPVYEPEDEPLEQLSNCDERLGREVSFHATGGSADWQLAVPSSVSSFRELTIVDSAPSQARWSAVALGDTQREVAGLLWSTAVGPSRSEAVQMLAEHRVSLAALGSLLQESNGGEFGTHDGHRAVLGRYRLSTPNPISSTALRKLLLDRMTPFGIDRVRGLPADTGERFDTFDVRLAVVARDLGERTQMLTTLALAPSRRIAAEPTLQGLLDDLTNTTNLASARRQTHVHCGVYRGRRSAKADFYWVLDQSGSMVDDYARVAEVANQFYAELNNTSLDYRLGVTTMDEDGEGRLREDVGWHSELEPFLGEVATVSNWSGNTYEEYGLQVARSGIETMRSDAEHALRPGAELITIFMSDEETQTFQDDRLQTPQGQLLYDDFESFFAANTTAYAIVGDSDGCGLDGTSYRRIAQATGGAYSSLCAEDISQTIEQIIYSASGASSGNVLAEVPITATLGVELDGEPVPRSRVDGYDYFPETNSISFFGSYRPDRIEGGEGRVKVSYEAYGH
ncbi:VWA domain-containing protein [Persicimonas caeni]|uniref:VWA domain-containing protein n=1 Tax=Persicimonas caeni TaxID=2292766 RepID=A0A4Y6PVT0_PERCE|nr:VWA domain-containing protein [Persicimonas caeni]QDG52418.1 VWA domain-containing protein [Persicimonas caeni]QED33640.1 VWA domain-containing protein [Persicimonas caeni]